MNNPDECQVCNEPFKEGEDKQIKNGAVSCKSCVDYLNIMEQDVKESVEKRRKNNRGKYKYLFYDHSPQEVIDLILGKEFNSDYFR